MRRDFRPSPPALGGGERLESRQLLAVVTAENLHTFLNQSTGNYLFQDSTSIEFPNNFALDAGSGSITISAPSVTIGDHAVLKTTGAFTIEATKTITSLPLTVWNQVATIYEASFGASASVSIGENASITAEKVTVTARAGDDGANAKAVTSIPFGGNLFFGTPLQLTDDILSLPASFQWKEPSATLEVKSGAKIIGSTGVAFETKATADATGQAIYSKLMDAALKKRRGDRFGIGVAMGFSRAASKSTMLIAQGSQITASAGAFTATATSKATAAMTSRVTLNQGFQQTNPDNWEFALAGTYLGSTSRVTVENNATITADKNVAISATTTDTNDVNANTASYRDGMVGGTFGIGFSYGRAEVIVDGRITAGKVDLPKTLAFNPAFGVDGASDAIVFPEPTEFQTGDEVVYSTNLGGEIPGLVHGGTYYTIVDPADARRVRLARTVDDALAGRAVRLGRQPTLTGPKGTLPIASINAAAAESIRFDMTTWPDGTPLFIDGQTVRYEPAAGQFLGHNGPAGSLIGPLPAGDYTVRVVPVDDGMPGMAIRLLDAAGTPIDFNDNPQFLLDDDSVLQVCSFDADSGQISFNFPRQGSGAGEVPYATPQQVVNLVNGQRLRYVEAFGTRVPGLETGRAYHAIVDPADPGVIRLAPTEAQALAADPAIQRAVPKLIRPDAPPLDIDSVEPGTGLVFAKDPGLAAGTAVVYRAVAGKPVGGLVDGETYYAYPLVNPYFEPEWPQYVVGLRTAADATLPLVEFSLEQSLSAGGISFPISGIDAVAGAMAVALPTAADIPVATSDGLTGGAATVTPITAGSPQIWNNASGGTFAIAFGEGDARRVTADIAFNAPATAVMQAINALALPGVAVTAAFGEGRFSSPWTLEGTGLDGLTFDNGKLASGSSSSRLTPEGLIAVSTAATGGSFTLAFPTTGGDPLTTGPIAFNADANAVRRAVNALPGLLAASVSGSGVPTDPWLVSTQVQPLRTGDPLVFHDAWGATGYGLIDGQTVYAVVLDAADQGKRGSLVIRLAASRADALAATPTTLPLVSTLEFGAPQTGFMSGTMHTLASTLEASGISLSAKLDSLDSASLKAANGSEPKLKDLLTRGEFCFNSGNWAGIWNNITDWRTVDAKNKGVNSPLAKLIESKLSKQAAANDKFTASASWSWLEIGNVAQVRVGGDAILKTPGQVSLQSEIVEEIQSGVESTVSKPTKGKFGLAVAVDVVRVRNEAKTIVEANAKINGGEGVAVDSMISYPWAGKMTGPDLGSALLGFLDKPVDTLAKLVGGKFGLDEFLVNHWVNAGMKQGGADKPLAWTISGSIGIVSYANDCTAWIEDGAQINQDTVEMTMPPAHAVTVSAKTDIAQTAFAGLIYVDFSPDAISKTIRRKDKFADQILVATQGKNSLGFSVGYQALDNSTRAYVGGLETQTVDGVTRPFRTPTGPLQVSAGLGDVSVEARNNLFTLQLGQAGGNAAEFGFSGSAAVVDVQSQKADAAILGGSDESRAATIDAGNVKVDAYDQSYVIPIAGAVLVSDSKGVGVSTAMAFLNRDVAARIGGREDDHQTIGWLDTLSAAGDVKLTATAGGAVTPSALAAAIASSVQPRGEADQALDAMFELPEFEANNPLPPDGKLGLALSGDYVRAVVTDVVQAVVNTPGKLAAAGADPRSLTLSATNDTLLQATAGAAAFVSGNGDASTTKGNSLGLAGSAAFTIASSNVTALVRQAEMRGFTLDVHATNARRIGGLAAGGSGATAGNAGTTNVQIVGSGVVNAITATTMASIEAATGKGLGNVTVAAKTDDKIWSAAGSFLFNVSLNGLDERASTPGKSLGIGAAVAVQNVTSTTTATMSDAVLEEAAKVTVTATDTSKLFTFAAGIVGTGTGSSLSGMWAVVAAKPTVTASIDGGSLDVGGAEGAGGGIDVAATSALLLVTAAGDLVLGRSQEHSFAAVGAAVAVVRATTNTESRVGKSAKVRAHRGNVSVTSSTRNPESDAAIDDMLADFATPHRESNAIWTFAAGVVSSNATASLTCSWSDNRLESTRTAIVKDAATVTADRGSISIEATDDAGIYGGAGSISAAFGKSAVAAVGAAVSRNAIDATTRARFGGTTPVEKAPDATALNVKASAAPRISTAAVGGAFSGKAGVGTSVVHNDIKQTVDAGIGPAYSSLVNAPRPSVHAGSVTVTATDNARIGAGAGQVGLATKGVAGGAAAVTNTISSSTTAVIERANVTATGAVEVKADANAEIVAHAVGVAAAFSNTKENFAGVGSGTGNTLVRQVLAAVRANSALDVGELSVKASDTSSIDTSAATLAIQFQSPADKDAGKDFISAAVGVSASTNTIGSLTSDPKKTSFVKAIIEDSTATVRGTLTLAATADLDVVSRTGAGAGDFLAGAKGGWVIAGAGAGSGNTIQLDVEAAVRSTAGTNTNPDTIVTLTTGGEVSITASNTSSIQAEAGGIEVAGAFGKDNKGVNVTVGAAATVNEVRITTSALVGAGSEVLTTGAVTLEAQGAAAIKAVSWGVAISLRGGAAAFDFSGAGSAAINTVHSETLAAVRGTVDGGGVARPAAGPVSLTAVDRPAISAGAGGLAGAINWGKKGGPALSVGVSYTVNDVSGSAQALVDGGTVRSVGDVSLTAKFDQGNVKGTDGYTVFAVSVAGTFDVSFGDGALFPLAGAGNGNTVAFTTQAAVVNDGSVDAGGGVSLWAEDRSKIYSNAGGVGLGLSFGESAGGVAIGAAHATTTVRNTTRAAIESATVEATRDVTLAAKGSGSVETVGYGVALTVAVSTYGFSAAGSGAGASTTMTNTIGAEILSAKDVTSREGSVSLSAVDKPQVTSRAGAGALAFTTGEGVALAPGAVELDTSIRNDVKARIATTGTGAAPSVNAANGAVALSAESRADVTSLAVAVAAAAAVQYFTFAFAGAGAGSDVTLESKITAEIASGTVTAGSVSLTAIDHDRTGNNVGSGALSVGFAAGASVGDSLAATVVDNKVSTVLGQATVTATAGGITLDTRGGNSLATEVVATSANVAIFGAAGAGGHAYTTDSSTFDATVGTGATLFSVGPLTVRVRGSSDDATAPDGSITAQAHGGSGALVLAVGKVIARATDATRRLATIGADVNLSKVASLVLTATSSPNVKAWSVAVDLGAVAVLVNQSDATAAGAAKASTGAGVTLPRGDVTILATSALRLDVEQTGVSFAGLAAGATQSTGYVGIATEASLGTVKVAPDNDRTGNLVVRATSRDEEVRVRAIAGSGGLFAGFGTTGDIIDTTTTRATLAGGTSPDHPLRAGLVDIAADRVARYSLFVDSVNITAGLGVGIARASYTAADGLDRVRAAIAPSAVIIAAGQVGLAASHRVERVGSDPTVVGVGGSVLVSGQQSVSNVTANVPATIDIGDGVKITSGTNALTQPGGIKILPSAGLAVADAVHLANLGLLVSGGRMGSYLDAKLWPQVTMGDGVHLTSHGRIDVGTTAFVAGGTRTTGWGGAIFPGLGGYATSNVEVHQAVEIGSGATFAADGSLSVTPGDDPTGASSTQLSLDATARVTVYGLLGGPGAVARTTLDHTSSLVFGSGANVASGGSMHLSARAIAPALTATGEGSYNNIGWFTSQDGRTSPVTSSTVTLDGTFIAGRENAIEITIPSDPTSPVRTNTESVFGIPLADAWKELPSFNPRSYIDQAGYSGDVANTLKSGVAAGPVGAITFAPVGDFRPVPLFVSGGSVTVTGDTIDTTAATFDARVGQIRIKNESPKYLVLGQMAIANVEGGGVHFRDGSGNPVSNPKSREPGTATITVEQTFAEGVGGSTYGPAVFLAQPVQNLGGDVTIRNAKGSFGQTSTIAAKRITIDTPNGVFAVDMPTADWTGAGDPSSQWADTMLWPGRDSTKPNGWNGDRAVMYAINAMKSPYDQGWQNAATDDQLNQWVYGNPLADRITYVFFGGSVPHYDNAGNTRAVNEGIAADARKDGGRAAWKMTDKYPAKDYGWDHAWMPKLQKLPSEYTSNDLPAAGAGTAVSGQVIVINAKTANINGTLEAGGDRAGDQSVVIPASLEEALRDYQNRYARGEVTVPIYRIPDDQLRTEAAADGLIGASFDARSGQIILDQATSTGGGRVSITGRIINTAGVAGKIKVRGGSGNLTVRNDTSLALKTANLQTGTSAKQGIVSITDLNIDDTSRQQTTYVYDGAGIKIYRGASGVDLPKAGVVADRIIGPVATFDPQQDARWEWQLGAHLTRRVNLNLGGANSPGGNFPGVDASRWIFDFPTVTADGWGPWTASGAGAAGRIVFDSHPEAFVQRLSAANPGLDYSLTVPYPTFTDFKDGTGFSPDHKFLFPSKVSLTMTMSVKADWPIGIDFSGTSFGEIRVASKGNLTLAGNAVASRVVLDSSEGAIAAPAGGGSIEAATLEVRAAGDIGSPGTPLRVSVDSVAGVSTHGGIWLDGRRNALDRPLVINGLTAEKGAVRIVNAGDLRSGNGGVTASSASFKSVAGGIGTLATPLVVVAGTDGTLQLDALAPRDVRVRQIRGDMLVGSVRSTGGSVVLEAAEDIYDADTWTIDPAAAAARIRQLEALGATDPNAYRADMAAFEQNVTSRYTLYWKTQTDADDLSLWRGRAAASLGITDPVPGTPTDQQIKAYVAGLRGELAAFFTETVGAGWQSLPQFQSFDPTYVYAATPAQVARFSANRVATAAQLAVQLAARALDNPPAGESVTGRVNVAGHDVTLLSDTGSVGKNDDPVTITAADLVAGNLTAIQKQELALAAAPGDARLVRSGDTVTAVVLNVRRPLVLAVGGRLDVDAPAGIAVAQKEGDLRIGRIGSRNGLVSVIADGSILNVPDRTIDMWSAPVDFSRPDAWKLFGDPGQTLWLQDGLRVNGSPNTSTGAWLTTAVPTGSFQASFTYQADGDNFTEKSGLAFVLAAAVPRGTGSSGWYGYDGLQGADGRAVPKVGFIFDPIVREVGRQTVGQALFDSTGTSSPNEQPLFYPAPTFWKRPVYVTLSYDAPARRMTTRLSNQPDGEAGQQWTQTYDNFDLRSRFGDTAFIGFTTGNERTANTHRVTNFSFATGATTPGMRVELPANGPGPWVVQASPAVTGFAFTSPAEGPTATFANRNHTTAAAWYPTPVRISQDFTVTFRYRHSSGADGMALVLQRSSAPTTALGTGGGGLGYAGIQGPKVGYLIDIFGTAGTRFDTTGSTGGTNAVALLKPDTWVTVTLTYDAKAKTFTERLTTASEAYSKIYDNVDLVELLGGTTATLGFTAAAGWTGAQQEIQSLVFDSPAVPLSLDADASRGGWQLNGSVQQLANGRLVIPDRPATATSTWYERPVTTADFETSFIYEAQGSRLADGLAFVMQRTAAGLTAIGQAGAGLGYKGLAGSKVGLLFNIYGTPGVRFDTGGEAGSFESVSWLVGGPVAVRLVHESASGKLTVTLSRPGFTPFSRTFDVDLPGILGSQAFMGFTSGTGWYAASQTISGFTFRDRGGIASDDTPAAPGSPTVRLWSSSGDIGSGGDEIAIHGTLEARAPKGSIHTNPPPAPAAAVTLVGGTRPDGTPVTSRRQLDLPLAAPGNRIVYSTNGGRTWRTTWRPAEGLNNVLVAQVNAHGHRSAAQSLRFVLDTKAPAAPKVALLDQAGNVSRTGRLRISGQDPQGRVEYSVNGSDWSSTYAPVVGLNTVRVRQIDLVGNVSRASATLRFTLKSSARTVAVALLRDTGPGAADRITWDGRLSLRGVEPGARVQYSIDGGVTWRRRFAPLPGENHVSVRQIDRVGNVSASTAFSFTLVPRPGRLASLARLVGYRG
jgi:hypothetical protein